MTLPGSTVEIIDVAPPAASLTDTGTAFVAGLSDRGAVDGQLTVSDAVYSLAEFEAAYGERQDYNGPEYDSVEAFFSEGGARLFFSRYVGPTPVNSEADVPVASSQFTATAKFPGDYGDAITVAVASDVITVTDATSGVTEVSPTLDDITAAAAWATASSSLIDITPIASGSATLTDTVAVQLADGDDDRSSATDSERQTALDRFGGNLGPGSVLMPGDTRDDAHEMLANHAADHNRFAYGDATDSVTAATVAADGTAMRTLGYELARHIQILEPWLIAPGLTAGSTRTIPPSGVQAGMAARTDSSGNPNLATAGVPRGQSRFALDVKYERSDTDRQTLADAGVTVLRNIQDSVVTYDDITTVDPALQPEWLGASGNRLVMRIIADALAIANAHLFGQISGPVDLAAFNSDLTGMLLGWFNNRSLYSPDGTPGGAFRVETGSSVNTPTTLQARQLKAALSLKISPNARQVKITITNTPITGQL